MFFSSVFVPSVALPAGRMDTLASTLRDPSSMFTSETPMRRRVAWSRRPNSAACARRAQVRLGDDLHQRRPAAVEVDDARACPVDPAARAGVDQLGRVLLEVHPVDAHLPQPAAAGQRNVVLADLVALREVRIEVVLAVEDRALGDPALERHRDHQGVVHGLGVDHRQRARMPQADRAGVGVRLVAEGQRAAAEHLGARAQLDVDLHPDHRLEGPGLGLRDRHGRGTPSKPIAFSTAWAASRMRLSLKAGPAIWKPTGSPSERPHGIETAGTPARGIGTVK